MKALDRRCKMSSPVQVIALFGIVVGIAALSWAGAVPPWGGKPKRLEDMRLFNQLTPLPRGEYTDESESGALYWVQKVLAPAFAPPSQSRFVLLPMDRKAGLVDRMLLAYEVGGAKVTVAQSASLFLVEIERPEWIKEKRLLKAEEVLAEVRRVFKDAQTVTVLADYGEQGFLTADPTQLEKHIWFTHMGWMQSEGHLALWCLKETGGQFGPTLFVDASNYLWFSYAPGEKPRSKPGVSKEPAAESAPADAE